MGKTKNEETDQSNKKHNKKAEKFKKKKMLKKNKKKYKEIRSKIKLARKQKEKLSKLKLMSEEFHSKVSSEDLYNVGKILKKLIDHNQDSIRDLPELFENLDEGFEVDIKDLQDQYVQGKLNKLFKLLQMKRSDDNKLEFRKRDKMHNFKLKPFIQHFIDQVTEEQDQPKKEEGKQDESMDSLDESDSESEDNSKDIATQMKEKENQIKEQKASRLEGLNAKINQMQYKEADAKSEQEDEDDDIGPKFEEAGQEFLQSTMNIINKDDEQKVKGPSQLIGEELASMFASAENKKKGGQSEYANQNIKYLGYIEKNLTKEEEDIRQEAITEYLSEYNEQNRAKTLLEEHQELKKHKKGKDKRSHNEQMEDFMKRPFNREKDFNYSGIDSAQAFKIINKNNLDKKFASGSHSYM